MTLIIITLRGVFKTTGAGRENIVILFSTKTNCDLHRMKYVFVLKTFLVFV